MATDWIKKVRKVSSDVEESASIKNPNFVYSMVYAYLSRNINRSGMRRETRDNQMSKAIREEELLSSWCSVGNYFIASGLYGSLVLRGGEGWHLVILQFLAGLKSMTIEREVLAFTPRILIPFCWDSLPNSSRIWLLICCWLTVLASGLCGKSFVPLRSLDNKGWGKF